TYPSMGSEWADGDLAGPLRKLRRGLQPDASEPEPPRESDARQGPAGRPRRVRQARQLHRPHDLRAGAVRAPRVDGGRGHPTRAADCPPPTNMPTTPVRFEVFIQGDPQNQPFPSAIARDPQCNCWAVSSVFGAPAVAWYNDDGSPHVGKGPVPAGNFNPFGIAFIPAGDLYLVDIHIQCTGGGPENPGASCGPQEDAGQILRVTFTSGFPSAPVTIAGGLNFPVSVTTCDASARTCPRPAPGNVGGSIGSVDWPTYGHDLHRTFNGKTSLDQTSVRTLAEAWSFPTGD